MKRVILALALGVSTSGCGTSQSDLIRSMAATAPSPPVTYTISGMVSEVTPTGINACRRCHRERTNRKAGCHRRGRLDVLSGLPAFITVTSWKPSYEADTRNVAISADTRLDIELTRRATFTLSGVVYEMTPAGPSPVEGVHIDAFSCEPIFTACDRGLSLDTATDREGFYSIPGVYAGQNFICAAKEGYQAELTGPCNVPHSEDAEIPVTAGHPLTVTGTRGSTSDWSGADWAGR